MRTQIALKLSRDMWNWDTMNVFRLNTLRVAVSTVQWFFGCFPSLFYIVKLYVVIPAQFWIWVFLLYYTVIETHAKGMWRIAIQICVPQGKQCRVRSRMMAGVSVRLSSWKTKRRSVETSCLIYSLLTTALLSWIFNKRSFNARVITSNSYPNM